MPDMLMSNPLDLAILGNPWRRPRNASPGTTAASRLAYWRHHRNPKRRTRRNPGAPMAIVGNFVSALKRAPGDIKSTFTGKNKVKNLAFAAGGAVGTYVLGGILSAKVINPALSAVGAGAIMTNPMAKRVVGGLIPFTAGYIASRFIKGDVGRALLVGGAVASLVEMISPGMVGRLVARTPVIGAQLARVAGGPVQGLDGLGGYVNAPSYQGVGEELAGYVNAPSYQGVGEYVNAPSYQGVGEELADDEMDVGDDALAGDDDGDVGSYLPEAQKIDSSYLN